MSLRDRPRADYPTNAKVNNLLCDTKRPSESVIYSSRGRDRTTSNAAETKFVLSRRAVSRAEIATRFVITYRALAVQSYLRTERLLYTFVHASNAFRTLDTWSSDAFVARYEPIKVFAVIKSKKQTLVTIIAAACTLFVIFYFARSAIKTNSKKKKKQQRQTLFSS